MPRKKKSAYEKYISAQKSIKSILAKYDGGRQTILNGKRLYSLSKEKKFQQYHNDCKNLYKYEKIVRDHEEDSLLLSIQEQHPTGPPQDCTAAITAAQEPQDPPCPHLNCNHCHNDVSIFFQFFFL